MTTTMTTRMSATAENHERSPRRFISSSPLANQSSLTSFRTYPRLQAPQGRCPSSGTTSSSSSPMLNVQNFAPPNKNRFVLATPKEIGMPSSNFLQLHRMHQTWCWPSSAATTSMDMIHEHHQQQQQGSAITRNDDGQSRVLFAPLQPGHQEASSPFVPSEIRRLQISMTTTSSPSRSSSSTPSIMASSPRRVRRSSTNSSSSMLPSSSLDDSFDEEVAQATAPLPPPPPLPSHVSNSGLSLKPRRSMRTMCNDCSFLF